MTADDVRAASGLIHLSIPVRSNINLKTILIIDGAANCAYDCFQADDELFAAIFPADGQDIEFIEDFGAREADGRLNHLFAAMWKRPVAKTNIRGIDGTLFYGLQEKKEFYPNKRDSDLNGTGRAASL